MNEIEVIGVYQLPVTEELFELAMKEKYPHIQHGHPDRAEVESYIRQELDSAVLIEVLVHDTGKLDLMDFTQKGSDQAAYDERFLSSDGERAIGDGFRIPSAPEFRVAFYIHFYDPNTPLTTSYGEVECPAVSPMPIRLRELAPYSPVD